MEKQKISAKVVADSIMNKDHRLTTLVITLPRIVLAEFNTHRMLSRNSASSRAVPAVTMMARLYTDPFIPIKWMKDHSGMQGNEYFSDEESAIATRYWLSAKNEVTAKSKEMNELGVTKQITNRLLEPFMWHTILATASEWENFVALRAEGAAEIHIQEAAYRVLDALNESEPNSLNAGEWHIPFGDQMDDERLREMFWEQYKNADPSYTNYQEAKVKIATARCARVSYFNFDGKDDYAADIKLHDRLAAMGHWSPFEHCAKVMSEQEYNMYVCGKLDIQHYQAYPGNYQDHVRGWCGNFRGFIQYRKMFPTENRSDSRLITKKWNGKG